MLKLQSAETGLPPTGISWRCLVFCIKKTRSGKTGQQGNGNRYANEFAVRRARSLLCPLLWVRLCARYAAISASLHEASLLSPHRSWLNCLFYVIKSRIIRRTRENTNHFFSNGISHLFIPQQHLHTYSATCETLKNLALNLNLYQKGKYRDYYLN